MTVGRVARALGTVLLWAAILLLLAAIVVPPFLDRIYYRGPVSGHFDGQRFRNPDGDAPRRPATGMLWRYLTGRDRAPWPAHVAVAPGVAAVPGDRREMWATWIGHSTVLVQAGGINILTDPIWSERAGPFGLFGPKRVRAPGIPFERLPHIDLVLVSHNHYDHMDLATLKRLWARDRPLIVTGLGNDTILRGAGVPAVARDWGGTVAVRPDIRVTVERVHHWGSRWGTDRNRALWSGFAVTLPGGNLFVAGDTGWGDGSWPAAAARDGPYRLAILPIGAYRPRAMMQGSHIGPVEAVAAWRALGAAYGLGVHWGTFRLSGEGIDDPPRLLGATLARQGIAADRVRTLEVGRPWPVPASSFREK